MLSWKHPRFRRRFKSCLINNATIYTYSRASVIRGSIIHGPLLFAVILTCIFPPFYTGSNVNRDKIGLDYLRILAPKMFLQKNANNRGPTDTVITNRKLKLINSGHKTQIHDQDYCELYFLHLFNNYKLKAVIKTPEYDVTTCPRR